MSTDPSNPVGSVPILVIDDDDIARSLLENMLVRKGYQVILAETGEEAVELSRSCGLNFQLAIIDYNMPGMDGIQTFLELRKLHCALKAVLYTGNPDLDQLRGKCPKDLDCLEKNYDAKKMMPLLEFLRQ